MSIRPLMTWVPVQKRWTKLYRGKTYSVSCRQLDCQPTKDQSVLAANVWWERKRTLVDLGDEGVQAVDEVQAVKTDEVQAAVELLLKQTALPPEVAARLLTLSGATTGAVKQQDHGGRTVGEAEQSYLTERERDVTLGNISITRLDAYRRHLARFTDWHGRDKDLSSITRDVVKHYLARLGLQLAERKIAAATASQGIMTVKQFLKFCGVEGWLTVETTGIKVAIPKKTPTVMALDEVRELINCGYKSERGVLYVLLCLNCGMCQNDIASLGLREVDLAAGTITRPRSKTGDTVVTYKLWGETLRLLKKYRAAKGVKLDNGRGDYRALVAPSGRELVCYRNDDGRLVRYDLVEDEYRKLKKEALVDKPLKLLRKTVATLLADHERYKYFVPYYLGHSPKGVAETHYVKPGNREFFEALDWVFEQLFDGWKTDL